MVLKKVFKNNSLIGWKEEILQFISMSKRPIFFIQLIDTPETIGLLLQDISSRISGEPLFICLNSRVPYYYNGLNLNFEILDDYLMIQDYESIDNFVYKFTREWYLPKDTSTRGITEYRGIHLGSIVEYDFQMFLIKRLKWFIGMHKVMTQENPDRIIILEDTGELSEAAELVGEIFHIPVLRLHNEIIPKDTYSLKRNFKAIFGDIITSIIDSLVRLTLRFNTKNKIIIDRRVYDDLAVHLRLPKNFMPTLFEKGLRIRLGLLKRGLYFPFYFPPNFKIKIRFHMSDLRDFKKMSYYNGLSIERLIEYKLKEYFSNSFPLIRKNIKLLEKFLRKNLIKAIILRHDLWELQKTNVELARRFKVPTIVVQHGVFGEKGEEIIFADKIAVWGKMCTDIYKSFGNDPNKCRVTGNPRLDTFYNRRPKFSRDQICDLLNLDKNKKNIVLASALFRSFLSSYMSGDENEIIISEVVKAMKELPQYQLIIKLHPYENLEFSNNAIRYYNLKNVVVVKHFDLFSLISATDLLITKRSTLGLKAMVLDKPVIVINFEKRREITPYVRTKAALEVTKPIDISAAIRDALENLEIIDKLRVNSQIFVNDYAYKIDGRSSERVLDFIKKAVTNNKEKLIKQSI